MPVPNTMADLATLASSNSPAGSETVFPNLDDYLRAQAAITRSTYAVSASTLPSASTTDLASSSGEHVNVTGTTTITSFGTAYAGCKREVRFAGACLLTHSSNLQLPGAANYTTSANDVLTFRCISAGQWVMTGQGIAGLYVKKTGDSMTGALGVAGALSPSSYLASANSLVIGAHVGDIGLTIASGTSNFGSIHFADAQTTGVAGYAGYLNYNHATNIMSFGVNSVQTATLSATTFDAPEITIGGVPAGYRGIPGRYTAAATNLGIADRGSAVIKTGTAAAAFTIQPQASVAWAEGDCITIMNFGNGAGVVTVARGAGVSLFYMDGSGVYTDANRTIAITGFATIRRMSTVNQWVLLSGPGVS